MHNPFQSKLVLIGSALIIASTSCSTSKLITNSTATNADKTSTLTQNLEQRLNQRLDIPIINIDSMLVSTLARYKPPISEMPPDIRMVDGDKIDLSYESPKSIDSTMIEHNIIVKNNAIRSFPKSKTYLGIIFKARDDYRNVFRVPPETMISLFSEESGFNPFIISTAPAFGIGQFMRETAEWLGMHVYSQKDFPILYKFETELAAVRKQYLTAENAAFGNFRNNNFEIAKMYKLKADSLYKIQKNILAGFEKALRAVDIKKLKDDRLIPETAIPKAMWLFTSTARQIQKIYHCSDEQAINWAIDAYNAGLGSIAYVKPAIETSIYNRFIHKDEAKLFPYTSSTDEKPYANHNTKGIPNSKPLSELLHSKK